MFQGEMLTQGTRILALAPPGSTTALQRVLRLLVDELPALASELWYTSGKAGFVRLRSAGASRATLFDHPPTHVPPPPWSVAAPFLTDKRWTVPLPLSGALLCIDLPVAELPPTAQQRDFEALLPLLDVALCHLRTGDQFSVRSNQQTCLRQLSRILQKPTDSTALFAAVGRLLLRQNDSLCVVLRGLHGNAVLASPQIFLPHAPSLLTNRCLESEPALALATLSDGRTRLRTVSDPSRSTAQLLCVPLQCGAQFYGTLCLGIRLSTPRRSNSRQVRPFLQEVGHQLARTLAQLTATQQCDDFSAETHRKLQELSSLLHISRALHKTLRVNELLHFLLSAVTAAGGGGFPSAALFMVNENSATLQGMLGVTSTSASLVLPAKLGQQAWEQPCLASDILYRQRQELFSRLILGQRVKLDNLEHPLVQAVVRQRIIIITPPATDISVGKQFAATLGLQSLACAPLVVGNRPFAVLVVGAPDPQSEISSRDLRFLELFARLSASALGNALLLRRLELANQDLKETQERLLQGEKLAVLGEMAASIAHELKTPLVTIGGFARRLENPQNVAQIGEYAGIISREARRLEELLEGILSFARKPMLCYASCDLSGMIEDVLRCEEDALSRAGIQVQTSVATDLPDLQADAQKLRQVLLNLVTNARQAMPKGGRLIIRLAASPLRGRPAVVLEVEDSGGGIADEHRPWLFTPFFSTKVGGTGLGLPITARIIEQHGGQIKVSNRAHGAVFTVRLPTSAKA